MRGMVVGEGGRSSGVLLYNIITWKWPIIISLKIVQEETTTKEIYHGNFFSKMTSKRMEFGGKDGPGPGDYEAYKQPQTVVEHAHIRNTDKTHFESNIPRYNDQIVHDAERMVSEFYSRI